MILGVKKIGEISISEVLFLKDSQNRIQSHTLNQNKDKKEIKVFGERISRSRRAQV